jgi:hypothetical protein
MSTGREAAQEHQEIPPTPHMEKQAKQGKGGSVVMPSEGQAEPGALSKDPSKHKDAVGLTDPKAMKMSPKAQGLRLAARKGVRLKWAIR